MSTKSDHTVLYKRQRYPEYMHKDRFKVCLTLPKYSMSSPPSNKDETTVTKLYRCVAELEIKVVLENGRGPTP